MEKMAIFIGFAGILLLPSLSMASNTTSCEMLSELEKELYEGKGNQRELNRGFFPLMQRTSRFLEVS